ncbi:MAG: acetoin dehydrogenase dihydrolipoyllysine-residue acetyltransferase subunit [Rhizobiaceae bacterium]|nr:acetoin dehydrogenase dihydrolipoyllysine-residue acetyltransferase subunit [Rhizobiaceae bacterium]
MSEIHSIVMPKLGLTMQEGLLADWIVAEGDEISAGQHILDIETSKIANSYESPFSGKLHRIVGEVGGTYPVGSLLGVIADAATPAAAVDSFVEEFLANFKPVEAGADAAPSPETATVDGQRMRYLRMGEGEADAVLLIHGFGSDHGTWILNHGALAEGRQVVAVDLPGHGGSTKDVGGTGVSALADRVVSLSKTLGPTRFHVVGHSLGAAVAAHVADKLGASAASLTLIAPVGISADVSADFLDGFLREQRSRKLRPYLEMLSADPSMISVEMVEDVLKAKRVDGAQAALTAIREANLPGGRQSVDIRDIIAAAAYPVQVILGDRDQILPSNGTADLPPSVKRTVIAGSGHVPYLEKANEVNALIQEML